jgi:membrane fusion protein, copper/silver efflux system
VEVTANAYPGQVFKGKISSLAPVLNKETRALQVRAIVEDREHKLKPEMFVNASINRDLGEKLAVPESAVLDTGVRKVVYVKKEDNTFEQREIKTGVQAEGYYEVLEGVCEGESVVTNGNFLIDSESRMKAA